MRSFVLAAGGLLVLGGLALAQTRDVASLYRPFEAPPGERTRVDVPWPAPADIALPAALPGIGRPATAEEIRGWDIAVRGDGHNLPPGRGTAKEGEELYLQHCASCHGDFGEGIDRWPALMGGRGSLTTDAPRRTVGSFWQHAPAVFDYIRRAMPYAAPQSLSNDEYYAITAYVLYLNELIGEEEVMDRDSLPRVQMPNRDGFVLEARPDTPNEACMSNCRRGRPVTITMDSRQFVRPGSESGTAEPQ
ncbi:MAG: cytochrome c [Rhodovarius sp.]|nr:cytochrome c [Rhodovarius sp.]MCX7931825.1 cytochrome c [Rhodovarius sp.]MDW8314353.1 cytochrome c [Rhodovarius sp.]